jgi:hypothetical protein
MAQPRAVAAMPLCRDAEATNHGFLVDGFAKEPIAPSSRACLRVLSNGIAVAAALGLPFARLTLRAQFGRLKKLCGFKYPDNESSDLTNCRSRRE